MTGVVTVNADGTGQAKYGGPLPDGTTPPQVTEDFVITNAQKDGRAKLALEISPNGKKRASCSELAMR